MELREVRGEDRRGIARRIAGDEDGEDGGGVRRSGALEDIKGDGHLVELFGTDVWAV